MILMIRSMLAIFLTASFAVLSNVPVYAVAVNNFSISNYRIEMNLRRDADRHSVLQTTETIVANFTEVEQNRGIERAIPKKYDGHNVGLEVLSVTKPDGSAWNYTTYDDNQGNVILRIGDADEYVIGTQTYIISYTQRDVTKYFADANRQEFYWDTNGTRWLVPIEQLTVEMTIDQVIASSRTAEKACYVGAESSAVKCQLDESGQTLRTTASGLAPGDNVTIAVGFKPDTFAEYEPTLFEKAFEYWAWLQAVTVGLATMLIAWLGATFVRIFNRNKELGTIVPEYIPPKNISVTVAAKITKKIRGSVMAAQLIDLAVRHYITIIEVKEKKLFGTRTVYHIEVIKSPSDLLPEEQELLQDMFGHLPVVGETLDMKTLQNNSAYYSRTTDNDRKLDTLLAEKYQLREVHVASKKLYRRVALGALIVGVVLLAPALLVLALVAFVLSFQAQTLTDKGLALRRYLEGLKYYISIAENDRINMLLGPESAQKVATLGIDAKDNRQRVVLYERVLPYAIIFGQEKEWTKQLGAYYDEIGTQPGWYNGSTAFSAGAFSQSVAGFTSASNSYGGASSSSSSGASGGGSSGGGGGGGGGGGW